VDELAGALTRQKQMLEVLVYRLEILRHMLGKGETRFLPFAVAEVEHAAGMLRAADQERGDVVARMARERSLDPSTLTLRALAESDDVYAPMFERLRAEFLSLTEEFESLTRTSKVLAGRGIAEVDRVLGALSGSGPATSLTYGPGAERRRAHALAPRYEAIL